MSELSRRDFLKLASAAGVLLPLGLCGCRRPEELVAPFSKPASDAMPGEPLYYATAMQSRMSALPLIVKTVDYHPIKIEPNPKYQPGCGSNRFAQAAIYSLYDPLRSGRFLKYHSNTSSQINDSDLRSILSELLQRVEKTRGESLCILTDQSASPSRERLLGEILSKYPRTLWFEYEPIDLDLPNRALSQFFGEDVTAIYNFKDANVILSLDCDFLDSEEDSVFNARQFAEGRTPPQMNRLYSVEASLSLTGANADHRLAVKSTSIQAIAAAIALIIFQSKNFSDKILLDKLKELSSLNSNYIHWIQACADDLLAAAQNQNKKPLVVCGYRQPVVVHLIALAINAALNSIGKTLLIKKRERLSKPHGSIEELAALLNQTTVNTLIICGCNPAYHAPSKIDWDNLRRNSETIIRLGLYEDETSTQSNFHIPLKHFLEHWADARHSNGTLFCVQPVIQPIWQSLSELEFFAYLAGYTQTSDYNIVRQTFKSLTGGNDDDWQTFLRNGFSTESEWKDFNRQFDFIKFSEFIKNSKPAEPQTPLEINFYRSPAIDDGRYFTNAWLQESPDPITKIVWDNPALISPQTASKLGLTSNSNKTFQTRTSVNCAPVKIKFNGRSLEIPLLIQPGIAEDVIALTVGYGRHLNSEFGKLNFNIGTNVLTLKTDRGYFAGGCELVLTPRAPITLARAQGNDTNPDEDIIIQCDNSRLQTEPDFVKKVVLKGTEKHRLQKENRTLYKSPELAGEHQWGLIIDLNRCIGCGACVIACRSENNIPIVGKEQILRGREMDWLRIDRYFYQDANLKVRFQPLMCMQCETAPCEYVCPVNATVHNSEGLNLMVYNRCIGARYCMNNCPYRVRRFNYFDYNRRMVEELFTSTDADNPVTAFLNKFIGRKNPTAPQELFALARNPSVTVRMRGVAEKCTYCIHRIQEQSANKKVIAGDSPPGQIEDGAIKTACQQACPTDAIVFGNLADPNSRVSQLLKNNRNYPLLGYLNTKPRTTYLAKITNPNPILNSDTNT
ncbi:MAG: 4Fe-4S dicluster domain-containing protein [Verrucomicrobiia bacterium]